MFVEDDDLIYRELLLSPLRTCKNYKPKFGSNDNEMSLETFHTLFKADPLYSWIGLDDPLVYAAHKAAGGITSIYRQLGIGCERLVRRVIMDTFKLQAQDVLWSYEIVKEDGSKGTLTLDALVAFDSIEQEDAQRMRAWVAAVGTKLGLSSERTSQVRGVVMEVRQGYKSADSKRQNADLRFALRAANEFYLPVMLVMSTQISQTVSRRYTSAQFLVLTGAATGDSTVSTYSFMNDVIGYDLSAFFQRNTHILRTEVRDIIASLLST